METRWEGVPSLQDVLDRGARDSHWVSISTPQAMLQLMRKRGDNCAMTGILNLEVCTASVSNIIAFLEVGPTLYSAQVGFAWKKNFSYAPILNYK